MLADDKPDKYKAIFVVPVDMAECYEEQRFTVPQENDASHNIKGRFEQYP